MKLKIATVLVLSLLSSCGKVNLNVKSLTLNTVIPISLSKELTSQLVGQITAVNEKTGEFKVKSSTGETISAKTSVEKAKQLKTGKVVRITKRVSNSNVKIPSKGVDEIVLEDITNSKIDYS